MISSPPLRSPRGTRAVRRRKGSEQPSHTRSQSTMLTEQVLRRGLKTRLLGGKVYSFESIDSTNTCAKALASCFSPEGTVVIAEKQTAGRGRLGRSWQANPGENLTFSIVLRPGPAKGTVNLLPLLVA